MNPVYRMFIILAVALAAFSGLAFGQSWDYLDVAQGYETLNLAVEGDTLANGQPKSLNRVYRLERGGVYLLNGRLTNIKGSPLRIWAADGAGPKPLIIQAVNQSGASDDFAYAEGNTYLKNLFISGIDNIGVQDRYIMAVYGVGTKVVLDGIQVDHSRQSHFRTYAADTKLYFLNCEFSNSIDLATPSNGRFFDARGLIPDSLVFQNCTVYLNSQRMIRLDGAILKNLILDHNTFYMNAHGNNTSSGLKQSGPIEIGKAINARITNNIFQDLGTEAMRHPSTLVPLDRMPIIHVDSLGSTTYTEESRNWVVRNNAYGWSTGFKTFWASIDTVKPPMFFSPYGDSAFFTGKPNFVRSGNFEEYITFTDGPSSAPLLAYVQHRFATNFTNVGNPDPRADRNGIGPLESNPTSFGPPADPYNFDYATSHTAYTAGDNALPVGDLNWFPSKKTEWLLLGQAVGVETQDALPSDFALSQNFPNPFNPATEIRFTLPTNARVSLAIFNALGQEVARLIDAQEHQSGTHQVTWNGADHRGLPVASGVYYYQLRAGDQQVTKKMIMMK